MVIQVKHLFSRLGACLIRWMGSSVSVFHHLDPKLGSCRPNWGVRDDEELSPALHHPRVPLLPPTPTPTFLRTLTLLGSNPQSGRPTSPSPPSTASPDLRFGGGRGTQPPSGPPPMPRRPPRDTCLPSLTGTPRKRVSRDGTRDGGETGAWVWGGRLRVEGWRVETVDTTTDTPYTTGGTAIPEASSFSYRTSRDPSVYSLPRL